MACNREGHSKARPLQRHASRHFSVHHPWQRFHFLHELAVKANDLGRLSQLFLRHREAESENVIGANAEIDSSQIPEAVDRESGAVKQSQGKSKLRDYQGLPHALAPSTRPRSTSFFQRLVRIHSRRLPRGSTAKQDRKSTRLN